MGFLVQTQAVVTFQSDNVMLVVIILVIISQVRMFIYSRLTFDLFHLFVLSGSAGSAQVTVRRRSPLQLMQLKQTFPLHLTCLKQVSTQRGKRVSSHSTVHSFQEFPHSSFRVFMFGTVLCDEGEGIS